RAVRRPPSVAPFPYPTLFRSDLRGRLMGVQMAAVTAGPRLGDVEAGAVANALGATTSVISGGLACIAGALALARLLPAFRRQQRSEEHTSELQPPTNLVCPLL